MESLITAIGAQWPWLILVAAVVLGIPYVIKSTKALKSFLWDPFVAYLHGWDPEAKEREDIDTRIADLEKQVQFLNEQVGELRYRDRMYWAWVVSDQAWHREAELLATPRAWTLPPHVSFDDFYDEWTKKHPLPRPYQT